MSANVPVAIGQQIGWSAGAPPAPPSAGEPAGAAADAGLHRGVYWKRPDSMRLVHLLIDPELRPLFLSMEPQPHRAALDPAILTYKQFWALAAEKFNDGDWRPAHLFPNDPHLTRCSPSKKSKEVDPAYLRDKYKALRKQFNQSHRRWEETGQGKVDNFWKNSGITAGTSDEGCWYMFLVLFLGKHEDVMAVVMNKPVVEHHIMSQSLPAGFAVAQQQVGGFQGQSPGFHQGGGAREHGSGGRAGKRSRADGSLYDETDHLGELNAELKNESLFKQQAEVLKFVTTCSKEVKDAALRNDEEISAFWRTQLHIAQAQLSALQAKLPAPPPAPAAPADPPAEGLI